MTKKAWELERELRDSAVPVDRRKVASQWMDSTMEFPHGDQLINMFWKLSVPGSFAPEIPYQAMLQAWSNQGYDVSAVEGLIPEGRKLQAQDKPDDLRVLTARLLKGLVEAPRIAGHPYHDYVHPDSWEEVAASMPASQGVQRASAWKAAYERRIYQGWIGQLVGGSFGTALEGYVGEQIARVYGEVRFYVTQPETINDDVVYELLFLDAYEVLGKRITSEAIAIEWVRQLSFGISAEGCALRNLNLGIFPPQSGSYLNPYSDWIGAQMRGMVCGLLAPADPMEAARLAHLDGVVSHARNGVYGEIYAAVLTSLAFEMDDPRAIVKEAARFIPARSEYAAKLDFIFGVLAEKPSAAEAWPVLEKHFERYNWIHAYPNLAADVFSLWYGKGDFTESMALLARAGYDVDCNGGLVGNVLGVIADVPSQWAEPIGDLLETYVRGKEKLSIQELAARTSRLAQGDH